MMKHLLNSIFLSIITFFLTEQAKAQCTAAVPSVYNITNDSVTMSWNAVSTDGYEYSIQPSASPAPTTGIATTNTMVSIGNLKPGTAYKAWLRTNCGSGIYTAWTSISFSTPCGVPATINVANIWGDSATLSWTSVSPTANYEYVVDTGYMAPAGSGTAITTNTVTVKGLLSGRAYFAFVRTDCGNGVFSSWSAAKPFFSAYATGINMQTEALVTVYPNPVTDQLYINGLQAGSAVTLYNSIGTVLSHFEPVGTQMTIDMTRYPAGVYSLQYTTGNGRHIVKLAKY